jgi:CRP/FNR family transcriptional regulator, cyclic AMP receptor protein
MYGVLVLDGLLGRRLELGEAASIELLGRGDIFRPWQRPPESAIPARVDWRVLSPLRLALLDERITAWIGLRRELTVAFAARLVRRANAAAYLAAIGHVKRVEERLLAMLWHLGSNWGHVTPQGVRIPFRLTHAVLGELVGAHRPSVTIGLRKLRDRGELAQTEDGKYLLTGAPPDWSRSA